MRNIISNQSPEWITHHALCGDRHMLMIGGKVAAKVFFDKYCPAEIYEKHLAFIYNGPDRKYLGRFASEVQAKAAAENNIQTM